MRNHIESNIENHIENHIEAHIENNTENDMKNKTMRESIRCAIRGIIFAFKTEKNYKYYAVIALVTLVLNILVGISLVGYCFYIMLVCLVLAMECVNTAIEYIANEVSVEYRERIKRAKDMAAGGVLLSGIAFIIIEGIILITTWR